MTGKCLCGSSDPSELLCLLTATLTCLLSEYPSGHLMSPYMHKTTLSASKAYKAWFTSCSQLFCSKALPVRPQAYTPTAMSIMTSRYRHADSVPLSLLLQVSLLTHHHAVTQHVQASVDWGRDAWLSSTKEPSSLNSPQHEARAALDIQPDSTSWTSALDQSKLTALWADSAGLLILYFTCVPPSKQVQQQNLRDLNCSLS